MRNVWFFFVTLLLVACARPITETQPTEIQPTRRQGIAIFSQETKLIPIIEKELNHAGFIVRDNTQLKNFLSSINSGCFYPAELLDKQMNQAREEFGVDWVLSVSLDLTAGETALELNISVIDLLSAQTIQGKTYLLNKQQPQNQLELSAKDFALFLLLFSDELEKKEPASQNMSQPSPISKNSTAVLTKK